MIPLQKSCSKCCKIFKVYLTILGDYTLKIKYYHYLNLRLVLKLRNSIYIGIDFGADLGKYFLSQGKHDVNFFSLNFLYAASFVSTKTTYPIHFYPSVILYINFLVKLKQTICNTKFTFIVTIFILKITFHRNLSFTNSH